MKIIKHTKIEVKQSPVHGWGVFATEKINEGEIIEECPLVFLPIKRGDTNYCLIDYTFVWPKGGDWHSHVLPLGYGGIYNHSNTPNATWENNIDNTTFNFVALRDIEEGEEIFTFYGDENYWTDGRSHIEVK